MTWLRREAGRRLAFFAAVFLLFSVGQYALRHGAGRSLNAAINVQVAGFLINTVTPHARVHAHGDLLESDAASIQVAQGCEGVDVMLLFVAAMLAMPLTPRRKLWGCLLGVGTIYLSNLLRLTGLFYCRRYAPEHFEAMHIIVGQTVIIVIALLAFAQWSGFLRTPKPQGATS